MKIGLMFEGGANRTYFSNGVIDALLEENIVADYVIGVSAGIANGISYTSGQIGRSLEISKKYMSDKRYMGFRYMFKKGNRSYYNIKFVFEELPNKYVPFDYEAFKNYKGEVIAVVTNLKTGKAEYLPVDRNDKTSKIIIASCSLPIMFQPIEINGSLYMDGGIADPLPIENAIENKCDKIITILTRERDYIKTSQSGMAYFNLRFRKYPQFCKALKNRSEKYNNSRKKIFELEKNNKVFVIAPKNTNGWKRTESNSDALQKMYDEGYSYAKNIMPELKRFLSEK